MYINTNKQNCNKFVIPDLDAKTTKNNKSTATHLGDKVPQNVCLPVGGQCSCGGGGGWGFLEWCAPGGLVITWVEHISYLLSFIILSYLFPLHLFTHQT